MGKQGYFISKKLGWLAMFLGVAGVATIIALSVVYSQEKTKNAEAVPPTTTTTTPSSTTTGPTPHTTPAPSNEPWDSYRLPMTLKPSVYNVTLWPRLTMNEHGLYVFTGHSTVDFQCVNATDLILIHSNKLNLTKMDGGEHHARLTGLDGAVAPGIKSTWLQVTTQYLVIQLNGKLAEGKNYQLHTEFIGELADDLGGFYRSEYYEGTQLKVLATTQMQPTDARKAFPCFDEPALKAVFHMTLIHDRGTVALANGMEIGTVNTTHEGQMVSITTFEPTPIMSTYLLAFVVCEYEFIRTPATEKVLIRIWARPQAIAERQGDYALEKTGPILQFFENYYSSAYPLNKSDQIALPDFSAGAMENWGLITYRETALLYNNMTSSNGDKEWVATVIAHELAHMWFGNLVTMEWWNDLWLNEGFATYVSYLGADYAEPEWRMKELFVLGTVQPVFGVDALSSSHPLSYPVAEINSPAQISELFDSITYSKGASVIRMLSEFLTEEVFKSGLSTYLDEFAYQNTVYKDLWKHLQDVVDKTPGLDLPAGGIEEIMNRWILQMGFPVVTVDTGTGMVSQEHFLIDPDAVVDRPSVYKYEWIVPITWMKNGVKQNSIWLSTKTAEQLPMKTTDWVLVNLDVAGFYRVNYDHANWERLLTQLSADHKVIPVINRAQIVDDAFNLARAEIIDTVLALRTTQYLDKETDYMPWEAAIRSLGYYFLMFDRTEVYGTMQKYMKMKVGPLFTYFAGITDNWTKVPEGHMDQFNQVNAISMACKVGVEGCAELTLAMFTKWMEDPEKNAIHPNLKQVVYCNGLAAGGVDEWNFAWHAFKNTSSAAEAEKLLYALSCTKIPWLLNRYLQYSLDPDMVRKQDATFSIVYIAGNVIGQPLAWDFIRANWEYIYNDYGGGGLSFGRLITGVTERFSTDFELKQLLAFKAEHAETGFGSATIALDQAIEKTKANINWVKQNQDKINDWLTAAAA
ncbi:aminopeptidase N-like [Engraulis encrasicolus]|uniref:aminopeptidase N-like n=1 Tax=Engraulis encrasicolus TaxID=184585 RepID=UPI002FD137CD